MRSKHEGVRNTVMAALLLVTLLLGARLAEGAVNTTVTGAAPLEEQSLMLPYCDVGPGMPGPRTRS